MEKQTTPFKAIEHIAWKSLPHVPDAKADNLLVDITSAFMAEKLEVARKKGRGGWHTLECSNEKLRGMMIDHFSKGDMIDVINLAAMIHLRTFVYKGAA